MLGHGEDARPWLCDVMHKPGELYEEGSPEAANYNRLPERPGRVGGADAGGGAGMSSILPEQMDPALRHLSHSVMQPVDLKPCTDSAGRPVVLGQGGFGQVTQEELVGGRCAYSVMRRARAGGEARGPEHPCHNIVSTRLVTSIT